MIEVKDNRTDEERVNELLQSMKEGAEYLKYIFAGDEENYRKALNIDMLLSNTEFNIK